MGINDLSSFERIALRYSTGNSCWQLLASCYKALSMGHECGHEQRLAHDHTRASRVGEC